MVRLKGIRDLAAEFERVRLSAIDDVDLNLFQFDYDLTFIVFFLNAEGQVYARYGGRDGTGPDARQSLEGLHYTMASVLAEHRAARPRVVARPSPEPLLIHEVPAAKGRGRCLHCHQAKEILHHQLKLDGAWSLEHAFRYPPPDNVGLQLELHRANMVERVLPASAAAAAGLQTGDRLLELNRVPIHSYGDAQYALDLAPQTGEIPVSWQRGETRHEGKLLLPAGWRRSDISWRPSLAALTASPRLYGPDLSEEEKVALGLAPDRLAFREQDRVSEQARLAGVQEGDIIIGVNDAELKMNAGEFTKYVRANFVAGETVRVNLIRDGRRLTLPMLLR